MLLIQRRLQARVKHMELFQRPVLLPVSVFVSIIKVGQIPFRIVVYVLINYLMRLLSKPVWK